MRALIAKVSLLAISVVLSLLFLELAIRLVMPQSLSIWSHTRDGIVIHRANVEGFVTPQGKRMDTNSVGMRDDEHAVEKPPGTFRILLMGDSFMEAAQVEWRDSMAHLVETALESSRARGEVSDVEIINASVSGWGTDDQRTYYRRYARDWAPDLVLVGMTLHNDLFDNLAMEFTVLDGGQLIERPREEMPVLEYARIKLQEWFAGRSHLYRLATGTLRAPSVAEAGAQLQRDMLELVRQPTSPKVERGWEMTELLLDEFAEDVRADGAQLVVFLVPLRMQVEPTHRRDLLDGLGEVSIDLPAPQRRMQAWGNRRDLLVVDLMPAFAQAEAAGQGPFYLAVDGHWNEAGHALAAETVAKALDEAELLPKPTAVANGSTR